MHAAAVVQVNMTNSNASTITMCMMHVRERLFNTGGGGQKKWWGGGIFWYLNEGGGDEFMLISHLQNVLINQFALKELNFGI